MTRDNGTGGREMDDEHISKQLNRLSGLLHADRTHLALEETEPELAPDDLGALAGVGFRSTDPDVQVSVYVFGSWNEHEPAAQRLRDECADDSMRIVTATNGPMLFFGHTRIDGPGSTDARFALGDIVSAFAGDE